MALTKVGPKYQVTIPKETREAVGLEVGDLVEATATKGVVLLRPKAVVDKTIKTPSLLALQSEAKKRGLDTLTPKKIEAVIARTRRAKARKSA